MPHTIPIRFLLAFVSLWLAGALPAAVSAEAALSAPTQAVSATQASQVLELLRDDKRRAELEQTLSVIAEAGVVAAPAPEPAPADTPAPPIALAKNGVVAQVFAQAGRWVDSLANELRSTGGAVLEVRRVGDWLQRHVGTPEARRASFEATWAVAVILVLAFAVEWVFWRLIKPARTLVFARAASRHARDEARLAAASGASGADARRVRQRSLGLLRRVPFALASAVLELVPLAAFLATTSLLIAAWGGQTTAFYDVLVDLIGAYAAVRLALAVVRLLVAPSSEALRLTYLSNDAARYIYMWARRIVIVAMYGTALADVLFSMGTSADLHNAVTKLVALVVHAMLIVMVVQRRRQVAAAIRGKDDDTEAGSSLRGVLADTWAFVAIFLIAALWVIWTLGVNNGFGQLLHYFAITAGVLLGVAVVSILVLGALDKLFFGGTSEDSAPADDARHSRKYYHVLVQRIVYLLIAIATLIALAQAWGLDALSWFRAGTVGRSIASAASTIGVACVLAILAWESVNLSINRRVERWTAEGDLVRATRLRTLIPILRTSLFIVIALVVVFTALNELGINIAPLLAGASIIGVALGFGSQKLVQDFITGIFLLMENAMQVGDFVSVAGVSGSVEYLSIRTVRLRAGDGSLHVVPFSSVSTVSNTNRGIGNASVRVVLRADTDVDLAVAAIKQVGAEMRADPALKNLILADLDLWGVDQVDGASVVLAGQIRTLDRGRWPVQRGFNLRILRRFRELGIEFANPQERFTAAPAGAPEAGPPPAVGGKAE